jgi:hypothetical protein
MNTTLELLRSRCGSMASCKCPSASAGAAEAAVHTRTKTAEAAARAIDAAIPTDTHVDGLLQPDPALGIAVALEVLRRALAEGLVPDIPFIALRLKPRPGVRKGPGRERRGVENGASTANFSKSAAQTATRAPAAEVANVLQPFGDMEHVVSEEGRSQHTLTSRRQPVSPNDRERGNTHRKSSTSGGEGGSKRPTNVDGTPRVLGAPHRRTLEERIWGTFLDSPRPRPPEKELHEAFAFLKKIDRALVRKYRVVTAVDVCGGHGLLAMLMLMLGKAENAVVLDLQFPPSVPVLSPHACMPPHNPCT